MNNINASSSEFGIREMNSRAQSLRRGGSSDQQPAGVPIITASNGRRNEEQQQQNVVIDSSHGAGDHSFDKAKDDDKEPDTWLKNGIFIVCSFFATFCLEAILNLPGGIDGGQLQSKPMNMTVDQLQKFQSFLIFDVSCFYISLMAIFLVTLSSCFHYKYSLYLNAIMIGALMVSAILLFHEVLVLATNDHLAHVAIQQGVVRFVKTMLVLIIFGLLTTKEFWSFIRKKCSKIRDLIS